MQSEWFDIKCPNCGDIIPGKESYLKSTHNCSKCNNKVQFIKASNSNTKDQERTIKSVKNKSERASRNLSTCPDCGQDVSKSAKACPRCGANLKRKRLMGCLAKGFLLFIAFGILGNIINFLIPSTDTPKEIKNTKANQSSYNQDILKATTSNNDPACYGKNQDVCDGLGTMLLVRGKLCYKMLEVTPLSPNGGGDRYRIKCQESSTSTEKVTYLLEFGPGNSSYEVR